MNDKYRRDQKDVAKRYNGDKVTHASHYISSKELSHFAVSADAGNNIRNYRNANAFTNQSEHNRVDNMLLNAHATHQEKIVGGLSYKTDGLDYYVPHQSLVDRVEQKIVVAKTSGAMDNVRMENYLRKTADRLNMDLRIFGNNKK